MKFFKQPILRLFFIIDFCYLILNMHIIKNFSVYQIII
jgi:hypothetical protein